MQLDAVQAAAEQLLRDDDDSVHAGAVAAFDAAMSALDADFMAAREALATRDDDEAQREYALALYRREKLARMFPGLAARWASLPTSGHHGEATNGASG